MSSGSLSLFVAWFCLSLSCINAQFVTIISQSGTGSAVNKAVALTALPSSAPYHGQLYLDGTSYMTNVPTPAAGWEYIRLNSGDRTTSTGSVLVTLQLLWEMRVVVFVDSRVSLPPWISSGGWKNASVSITSNSAVRYDGWYHLFPPGIPISINGMGCSITNCAGLIVMAMLNPGGAHVKFYNYNPIDQSLAPSSGSSYTAYLPTSMDTHVPNKQGFIQWIDFGSSTVSTPSNGASSWSCNSVGGGTCPYGFGCVTPGTTDNTGMIIDGYFMAPLPNSAYTMGTYSDDGSRIWMWDPITLANVMAENNDGGHSPTAQYATVNTVNDPEVYRFRTGYFNTIQGLCFQAGFYTTILANIKLIGPNDLFTCGDAYLSNITIAELHSLLTPSFSTVVTAYSINVPNQVTSVTITPTTNHVDSTTNTTSASGLQVGSNTITIGVISPDTRTFRPYTLTVTRFPTEVNACNCDVHSVCTDQPDYLYGNTAFLCSACNAGYSGDAYILTCMDINACISNPCGTNAVCTDKPAPAGNTPNDRTCACPAGTWGTDPTTQCNACSPSACSQSQTYVSGNCGNTNSGCQACSNTLGAGCLTCSSTSTCSSCASHYYTTTGANCLQCSSGNCGAGYSYTDSLCTGSNPGCVDINACVNHPCLSNEVCFDLPAPAPDATSGRNCSAFACGSPMIDCSSVLGRNPCSSPHGDCGSCLSNWVGYQGHTQSNGTSLCCTGNCQPLNRAGCTTPGAPCGACNGGFTSPFSISATVACTDINECSTNNNAGCSPLAGCINTFGSYACGSCPSGYSTPNSGVTCIDINECAANNGGCDSNANCFNTAGSNFCVCKTGFSGSGTTCTETPATTTATTGQLTLSVADNLVATPDTLQTFRDSLPRLLALLFQVDVSTVFITDVQVTATGQAGSPSVTQCANGASTFSTVVVSYAIVGATPNTNYATQFSSNCSMSQSKPITDITGGDGIGVSPTQPPTTSGVQLTKCSNGAYATSCSSSSGGGGSGTGAIVAAIIVIVALVGIFTGLVVYRKRTHDESWKEALCTTICCCGLCSVPDDMKEDKDYKMKVGDTASRTNSPRNGGGGNSMQMTTKPAASPRSTSVAPTATTAAASSKKDDDAGRKSGKSLLGKSVPKSTSSAISASQIEGEPDNDTYVPPPSNDDDFMPSSVVRTPTAIGRQNTSNFEKDKDKTATATAAVAATATAASSSPRGAAPSTSAAVTTPRATAPSTAATPRATAPSTSGGSNSRRNSKEKDDKPHTVSVQVKPASPTSTSAATSSSTPSAGTTPGAGGGGFFSSLMKKKDKTEAKTPTAVVAVAPVGSEMTFEQCLASAKGLELFSAFLDKEMSSENLLFWKEVEKYRARKRKLCETVDPGSAQLRKDLKPMAIAIYSKFISKTVSSLNVNVPEDVDARLVSRLRQHFDQGVDQEGGSPDKTVFDEAQEVIIKLMESDSWKRFVKTPEYAKL